MNREDMSVGVRLGEEVFGAYDRHDVEEAKEEAANWFRMVAGAEQNIR